MLRPADERVEPWLRLMTAPHSAFDQVWAQALAAPVETDGLLVPTPEAANWSSEHPWTPAGILAVLLMGQRNLSRESREQGLSRMLEWHRRGGRDAPLRGEINERCLVIWALAAANSVGMVATVRSLGVDAFEHLTIESESGKRALRATHPDVIALPQSLAGGVDRWPNRSRLATRVRAVLEAALTQPGAPLEGHERAAWQNWLREDLVSTIQRLDRHWAHALVEQEPESLVRQATAVRLIDRLQKAGWRHARSRDDARVARWSEDAMNRLSELFPDFRARHRAQQAQDRVSLPPVRPRHRA